MSTAVALTHAKEPLELIERDLSLPAAGEVLLRVEACALGQLDWNVLTLDTPPRLPLIPGVEGVGVIEAAGPGVTLATGTRVLVTPLSASCGACPSCTSGNARWCAKARWHGLHADGLLASHALVAAQHLVPIDATLPAAAAAALGGTGWTAAGALRSIPPGLLGVFGVGGVGHVVIQLARQRGHEVLFTELQPDRAAWAERAGARRLIREALDAAIVCTPSTQAIQHAARAVRPGGVIVLTGMSPTGRFDLPVGETVLRGVHLVGSVLGTRDDLEQAVRDARPEISVAPMAAAVDRQWWLRDGGFVGRLVFTP